MQQNDDLFVCVVFKKSINWLQKGDVITRKFFKTKKKDHRKLLDRYWFYSTGMMIKKIDYMSFRSINQSIKKIVSNIVGGGGGGGG
mgnify:CR=1 FL=1